MSPDASSSVGASLLERDDALTVLTTELDAVASTRVGRIVLVRGEAGIGKTTLVRAFAADASLPAEIAACDNLRTPRAFGPVLDIANSRGGALADITRPGVSREVVFNAVLDLLTSPTLLVIEDLHWADEATLDLITFVSRRVANLPSLVLLTYRDDEVGRTHPLWGVLGDAASAITQRVTLTALSRGAVKAIAGDRTADIDRIFEVTGGNPFFVTETLASADAGVAESVREAVLARAARLSPAARLALESASMVPGRVEPWLVEALGVPYDEAVDECVDAGVLRATPAGLEFRHELARQSVYDAIAPARRRRLHELALAALISRPAGEQDLARIAFHAAEAGDIDAVIAYAPAAAMSASASGAHTQAVSHLEAALNKRDRLTLQRRGELLERLGLEYYAIGRSDNAVAVYDEALECWERAGDLHRRGATLAARVEPLTTLGRQPEAIVSVLTSLDLLEPLGPSPELAYAYAQRSAQHMRAREFERAAQWGTRAIELASDIGDDEHLCYALIQTGIALTMDGDDTGLARIARGIDIATAHGWDHRVALGWMQLGSGTGEIHRYDLALPALESGIAWCRDHEFTGLGHYCVAWLARCRFEQGQWDDAAAMAEELIASPRCEGIDRMTALTTLGRLRARRGERDVWAHLDEASMLASQTGHVQRLWPAASARAEAAWLAGHLETESDALAGVHALALDVGYGWAIGELELWLWRAGRLDAADPRAARPYALHIGGDTEGAAQAWDGFGCPYDAASARADGDPDQVRAAYKSFVDLGAMPAAQRAASRLRSLGERVPRGPIKETRSNPAALTEREVEIVGLLAIGLSNQDIADRLTISVRTAAHHVSHVLTKLGAKNRTEAVSIAADLGVGRSSNDVAHHFRDDASGATT